MILCFDMDGTLTESRQPIDYAMEKKLQEFIAEGHRVWIVTGSTEPRCREQLRSLFHLAEKVFCCSGAEEWIRGQLVNKDTWSPDIGLVFDLYTFLDKCDFPHKTGKHIDIRSGMVNFSITGQNASQEVRDAFQSYDRKYDYRRELVWDIQDKYPDLHVTRGGTTSIDICPVGGGKQSILKYFDDEVWFFCDEASEDGNDFILAQCIIMQGGKVYHVRHPDQTYDWLEELKFD